MLMISELTAGEEQDFLPKAHSFTRKAFGYTLFP